MTAKPDEARSKDEFSGSAVHFLDRALHQLKGLMDLVSDFCSNLDSQSLYRILLESSHRIFHWFGYVRDTIASLISERCCILDDLPVAIAGWSKEFLPSSKLTEFLRDSPNIVSHTVTTSPGQNHCRDITKGQPLHFQPIATNKSAEFLASTRLTAPQSICS